MKRCRFLVNIFSEFIIYWKNSIATSESLIKYQGFLIHFLKTIKIKKLPINFKSSFSEILKQ